MKVGMNLRDIKALCEDYLLKNGADSFWYWDIGAFVFAGDETVNTFFCTCHQEIVKYSKDRKSIL